VSTKTIEPIVLFQLFNTPWHTVFITPLSLVRRHSLMKLRIILLSRALYKPHSLSTSSIAFLMALFWLFILIILSLQKCYNTALLCRPSIIKAQNYNLGPKGFLYDSVDKLYNSNNKVIPLRTDVTDCPRDNRLTPYKIEQRKTP
jgi:hypothetical protein